MKRYRPSIPLELKERLEELSEKYCLSIKELIIQSLDRFDAYESEIISVPQYLKEIGWVDDEIGWVDDEIEFNDDD
jgi:hypothetical protein